MENVTDVIVVGGGPSGSFAAMKLISHGCSVRVFEEHAEIGIPSHCAGHLSVKGLRDLGLWPLPKGIVENTFRGAIFHSPRCSAFRVRFSSPVTCTVNRALFDKHIAEMAQQAGVRYHLDSRVNSLVIEAACVRGVLLNQNHGTAEKFFAKVVVDAEGISSHLLRQVGLKQLDRTMLVNGVEAEIEGARETEPDMVEVFLGSEYAPGFYAWLIPQDDHRAKCGLATKNGSPKELLRKFMYGHPIASRKLGDGRIVSTSYHPITLGGPIPKTYSNGFLVLGDAASQVKPTTGGGVVFGMMCARIAAKVVCDALQADDVSSNYLKVYREKCDSMWGFDVDVMLRLRRMLDGFSDKKIDEGIRLCSKLGLEKALRNFSDVDFQGRSFLSLVRSPRMLPVLLYFFLPYLSANA